MQIKDRAVLVTGANRGLGRAFVRGLLERGAGRVYAAARDPAAIETVAGDDRSRVIPIRLDVTAAADVARAVEATADTTILINNAGVLSFGGALEVDRSAIERDMAVNFAGMHEVTRAFAPVLAANGGGTVVNVLTLLSFVSAPGFAAYNASKAAAWSMAMSLRAYLAPQKIAVLNAFPAGIDTQMLEGVDGPKDRPEDVAFDILEALEAGEEDAYPASARAIYESWRGDQKQVERMFASMT